MPKKILFFVVIFIFLLSLPIRAKVLRIYGVQSYGINHICGYPQLEGFKEELEKLGVKYVMRVYYLEARTVYTDEASLAVEADWVLRKILQFKPDAVVLFDDAAFRALAPLIPNNIPIIFSGMNNYYSDYLHKFPQLKNKFICGVEELISLTKFAPLLNYFDQVWVIYGETPTSRYALKNFLVEYKKLTQYDFSLDKRIKLKLMKVRYLTDIQRVIEKLNAAQSNILVVITAQRVLDRRTMKYLHAVDILKYFKENDFTQITSYFNLSAVRYVGLVLGPNFYEMGQIAADLLYKCVVDHKKGQIVSSITYIWVSRGNLSDIGKQDFLEKYMENFDEIKP